MGKPSSENPFDIRATPEPVLTTSIPEPALALLTAIVWPPAPLEMEAEPDPEVVTTTERADIACPADA
ncbi:MAG: hypothetical protein ACXWUB_01530, partial [Burkholderiales bacterium]